MVVRLIEIKRRYTWWDRCVATYDAVYLYKSIVIRDSDRTTVGRCYPSEHDRGKRIVYSCDRFSIVIGDIVTDNSPGAVRRNAWSFTSSRKLFPRGKRGIALVPATEHGKSGGESDASVETDRRQALPITRRTEPAGKVSSACRATRDKESGGETYSRIGVAEISATAPRDRLNDAICEVIREIVNFIEQIE